MAAILYGIGVGPGDPELLTLKALKTIRTSDVLCFISNEAGRSIALDIVKAELTILPQLLPVVLPMKTDRGQAKEVYDDTALKIEAMLNAGQSVAMICEGDPFYYASFIYIYERLYERCTIEVIPGISAIHAAAANLRWPLCTQQDRQAVVTARSTDNQIITALKEFETVVILKAGRDRHRIKTLILASVPATKAAYAENIGHANEFLLSDITLLPEGPGGYFALFLCVKPPALRSER
ncbi:MAG: precorrin-2 C(20)-methyltransferase [Thiohalomonadales bacterium]